MGNRSEQDQRGKTKEGRTTGKEGQKIEYVYYFILVFGFLDIVGAIFLAYLTGREKGYQDWSWRTFPSGDFEKITGITLRQWNELDAENKRHVWYYLLNFEGEDQS